MSKLTIELNSSGVRELLRSAEMESFVEEKAKMIAMRCGEGYSTDTYRGKGRVNASIFAESSEAYRDNLDNNTLLKAVR